MANVTVDTTSTVGATQRNVVRTSGNRVYVVTTDGTRLQIQKGNQDGEPTSFSEVGSNVVTNRMAGAGACIDSNDDIHIVSMVLNSGMGSVKEMRYYRFDTSTDTFDVTNEAAGILDDVSNNGLFNFLWSIRVDANNDPHIVWNDLVKDMGQNKMTVYYDNRIGGTWGGRILIKQAADDFRAAISSDLIIGEPTAAIGADRPIIVMSDMIHEEMDAFHGNALNATSFTEETNIEGSAVMANEPISIAIDSNGDIIIAFIEDVARDLREVRHLSSNSWTTWESPTTIDSSRNYDEPTIAVIGTDTFVFCTTVTTANDIHMFRNEGSGYSEETDDADLPNLGTNFDIPHVKWANKFNHIPRALDYVFNSSTTVLYNTILIPVLKTHTTDSLLVVGGGPTVVTKTHDTDSVLKKLDNEITHTTDSVLRAIDNEITHTTDSVLKAIDTRTHDTDSVLKQLDNLITHDTDSVLRAIDNEITHTTDSFLVDVVELTHTTDSVLKKLDNEITHTTDSVLKKLDNLITHTTDSVLKAIDNLITHTTDSFLLSVVTKTHTTDSVLKKLDNEITHTTDSVLKMLGSNGSGCFIDKTDLEAYIKVRNNDVTDSSGNGNDGTWTGTEAYTTGKVPPTSNGALSLNGSSRVELDGVSESRFDREINQPFTIVFWFKNSQTGLVQNFVTKGINNSSDPGYFIHQRSNNDALRFAIITSGTNGVVSTVNTFNDGVFHQCVVTYEGLSERSGMRIFVDGVLEATGSPLVITGSMLNNAQFTIAAGSGGGAPVTGEEDDIMFWKRQLSPTEIRLLYQGGSPVELDDNFRNDRCHDTDSVLKKLDNEITHTTDSVLREIDNEITHTTDSVLKKLDNLLTHTTDSLLVKRVELTHTTDSVLKKLDSLRTHTTDSVLKKLDNLLTHTTDSFLLAKVEIIHTTDSVLKKLDNLLTHTTDSVLKSLDNLRTHTTDSALKKIDNLRTHTTDSVLKKLDNLVTHTTDSFLAAGVTVVTLTHTTDSVLRAIDNLITHTTDSLLKAIETRTHTTDSVLKKIDTRTHTTDSVLKKLDNEITHDTDSVLRQIDNEITHTTDSFLKSIETRTHTTDSVLKKLDNLITHTTDSFLATGVDVVTVIHTTDSLLKKLDNIITHTTDSLIGTVVAPPPAPISEGGWVDVPRPPRKIEVKHIEVDFEIFGPLKIHRRVDFSIKGKLLRKIIKQLPKIQEKISKKEKSIKSVKISFRITGTTKHRVKTEFSVKGAKDYKKLMKTMLIGIMESDVLEDDL